MTDNSIIYMHRNLVSGKAYIGLTTRTVTKRWIEHCYAAYKQDDGGNYISDWKFHQAIRKYGVDTWEHLVLYEGGSNMSLGELEIYYIEKHNTYKKGYNSTIGGDGVAGNRPTAAAMRKGMIATRGDTPKGYYWSKKDKAWNVVVVYLGKHLSFGQYKEEQDAKDKAAYLFSLSDEELLEYHTNMVRRVRTGKGYFFHKDSGKWRVKLTIDGKTKYFGYYDTEQEAIDKVIQIREGGAL